MNLLDHALVYLAAGLRPLPVVSRDKMPSLSTWRQYQKRAPTAAELEEWFADESKNMGSVIPPGVIVVDMDGGKDAEELLTAAGITLPEDMPRVQSGGGGYHGYLKLPPGVKDFPKIPGAKFLSNGGKKPFVEILTFGNFVVLPPSTHPNGNEYRWVVEWDSLPVVPPELMKLIIEKQGGGGSGAGKGGKGSGGGGGKNEPGWVEELSLGCEYGSIDDSMTKLAGHFLKKRLSVSQVIDIIDTGFARRCTRDGKPFRVPMSDIKRVVESIQRSESRKDTIDETEFQLLGQDHGAYYYFSRMTGQIVELTAREHDKHNLQRVAPLRYWESKFGTENGIFWAGAQAQLMDAQSKLDIYDPNCLRGRGAWWDNGIGALMHTGKFLLIDGKSIPIREVEKCDFVYEHARPLDVQIGNPLNGNESIKIMEIFENLSWDHPHYARLAAGWCVIATICGAVEWRPHLWVTGPSGSGKSWVVDNLIKRLLGNLALVSQGETTEAGIRQTLGHDALPLIFDEAEAKGQRGDARMANVLSLIRQASSQTGGKILKGSADGTPRSYEIRSCFLLSSINVSATETADKNRITILEMRLNESITQDERQAKFTEIQKIVTDTLTDEFVASFRARCIQLIPVIRENVRVFSAAAASAIGNRRLGDQIGTLLAGAYSLVSNQIITHEDAIELIQEQDLTEQKALHKISDENELLNHILQHVIRLAVGYKQEEKNIASLLLSCHGTVPYGDGEAALANLGFKITPYGFVIANSHSGVAKILEGTRWAKDWGRTLKRLPRAQASGMVRIGAVTCRGVELPWDAVE